MYSSAVINKTVVQSVILIVEQEPILLSNDFYPLIHFETS